MVRVIEREQEVRRPHDGSRAASPLSWVSEEIRRCSRRQDMGRRVRGEAQNRDRFPASSRRFHMATACEGLSVQAGAEAIVPHLVGIYWYRVHSLHA